MMCHHLKEALEKLCCKFPYVRFIGMIPSINYIEKTRFQLGKLFSRVETIFSRFSLGPM